MLPPGMERIYESLRAQVLQGAGRPAGLAAIVYHGMVHGLALIATNPPPPKLQTTAREPAPTSAALVRQLANMILTVQAEVMHVY